MKTRIHYNPISGIFTWKTGHGGRKVGDIAGGITKVSKGYIIIRFKDYPYFAHRLAFFYMKGYFPKLIDHINRIRYDNRWCNLRETNHQQNLRNCNLSKNNKSGITGVFKNKKIPKWEANIKVDYKNIRLGYFKDFKDAVIARYEAEVKYGFIDVNPKSSSYYYLKGCNYEKL